MGDINKNGRDFLRFISNPLSSYSVETVYKANKVVFERVEMYLDFILSINSLIQDTYLGDDVCTPMIQKQHFDWAWKKVCDDFASENILFHDNKALYHHLKLVFDNSFYILSDIEKDNPAIVKGIEDVWIKVFDYKLQKKATELDVFIDIWDIFEKSLKKP